MSRDRATERLAALSVDLDEVACYASIHGLEAPSERAANAIYDRALPRFLELFGELDVPATFFVIGTDVDRDENRDSLERAAALGHELANHSHHHLYDLTQRPIETLHAEVRGGADAIERACGRRPVGFRSPGYTTNDALLGALREQGYLYDSSVFPCPAYYGAKAAALGLIRARGRQSHSILDDPRVLSAPADPYRVGRPYWRRDHGLLELPIGVTRDATGRLPYIGTFLALAGERGSEVLTRLVRGRPLVNLELHGIDLADASLDGLSFLQPHQPDLRRSRAEKDACLRAAVAELKRAGYRFVTLEAAARHFAG